MQKRKTEIRCLIFDLGNVLVNYDVKKTVRRFSKRTGIPERKIWLHFLLSPSEKAYTRGEITSYEFFRHTRQALKADIRFHEFKHDWNDIFWENPGMADLLRKLRKTYPLYLISNTNKMHFEYIKKKYPLLKYFKRTFPSHEVGSRKPDLEIYQKVLRAIRREGPEVLFIDDMPAFVRGARKAGMNAVRFRDISRLRKDLASFGVCT